MAKQPTRVLVTGAAGQIGYALVPMIVRGAMLGLDQPAQASALEQHVAPDCKVLVVANPANTNALILKEFAPSYPSKNITCLTRLDHNRALGQVSEKLNIHVGDVKNVTIWGNHSSTSVGCESCNGENRCWRKACQRTCC
ncbi:hypothetical protein H5410_017706 [Solanum commersonii]|uniref:Lactate/malate dehydrogenase C-terminal domain-containing protein n=1 Tax=Solanum commersonii TaxID=4109 RepID=A0A9J6A0S5_SOLCO|nr:hypothetical protein H5410_017706 [Solanum commersonii]